MDITEYIEKQKQIEQSITIFLSDDQNENSIDINKLKEFFTESNIFEDGNEFRTFLLLISCISRNLHRSKDFYSKLEQILLLFKDEYKKFLTNSEIFFIFKNNKNILLFLFENEIIKADYYIANYIHDENSSKYPQYFINEIRPFLSKQAISQIESEITEIDQNNFNQYRKDFENEKTVCKYIREDLIDDFVVYSTKNSISPKTKIEKSIFETNNFLNGQDDMTLIEYAAFYGSYQIFNYLRLNNAELSPSLWLYAVHGRNPEIIHRLEESEVIPTDQTYKSVLLESIKCHHNEIAEYIINKYYTHQDESIEYEALASFNYFYFPKKFTRNVFDRLCLNGYYYIIEKLIKNKKFDANYQITRNLNECQCIEKPLYSAILNNHTNIFEFLLENSDVDINFILTIKSQKNEMNYSASHIAIINNNLKILKLLFDQKKFNFNNISYEVYNLNDSVKVRKHAPIIFATFVRCHEIVEYLLSSQKIDVNGKFYLYKCQLNFYNSSNFKNYDQRITALYQAIHMDDISIIKLILSNPETKINQKIINNYDENTKYKETSLNYAIRRNQIEIVKILLSHQKIDVNKKSLVYLNKIEYNESPLYSCVRQKNIEMIKLLLENPLIDVNSKSFVNKTEYEETALNLALRNNDKEIIKILLKHQNIDLNVISTSKEDNYSNIEINEYTVLQTAIEFCDIEIIELILNNSKIDINHLSKSTKINDNDNTKLKSKMAALHTAIILKKKDVVPLLLKNENIQINLNGVVYIKYVKYKMNPLNMAIYYQQNEICRELLSNSNIEVNSNLKIKKKNEFYNLKPSLFLAVEKKMFEIVQLLLLLHQKIDVNAKSFYAEMSMTKIEETFILHKAFEMNNLDIIKCLINSDGIDFNVVSTVKKNEVELYEETSNTTFYYAIELGNIEIIKLLLEKQNIDLNMKSYLFKSTPKFSFNVEKGLLLNALQSNNKEIFKLLVDYALMNDTKLIPENFIDFIKMTNDDEVKGIIFNVVNSNEFS